MTKEIRLPELGENIQTAVVGTLLISAGDSVHRDQPIIEVETDKAIAEVPSPYEGVVKEVHVKQGEEIQVGRVILTLETGPEPDRAAEAGPEPDRIEDLPSAPPAPLVDSEPPDSRGPSETAPPPPPHPAPSREPPPKPEPAGRLVPASPSVRRLARELGVDLATIQGSGPGGRISAEDVKGQARRLLGRDDPARPTSGPPGWGPGEMELPDFQQWGPVRREPMTGLRRAAAQHLSRSWSLVPQVTQFDQADITDVESLRKSWNKKAEAGAVKLTLTAILLKVAATALKVFPRFNASLDMVHQEILYKQSIHLGVAVDAGHGLLVPVIRDADTKNMLRLSAELTQLSQKARGKKLGLEEMRGATFTVSNLGGLGTTYFSPLVNWPEVAILGLGRATLQPVHGEGGFVPRLILPLSLSYDHRLIDGADAARFLRWIAEALEQPLKLAVEG